MKTSTIDRIASRLRVPGNAKGVATVELALVLPLLVVLVLGVYELSQAIAANNVITNMSREGANLASRTGTSPQEIMKALGETASQIDVHDNGIIYLTRILQTNISSSGKKGPQVLEQYRWGGASLADAPESRVWVCDRANNWVNDQCDIEPDIHSATRTADLDMPLNAGEEVVVMEVFYLYQPVLSLFKTASRPLYSRTLL